MTYAWCVNAMVLSQHTKDVHPIEYNDVWRARHGEEKSREASRRSAAIDRRMERGELIPSEEMFKEWAWIRQNAKGEHAPPFSNFGGNTAAVNQATKDLLETFDLGAMRFHPISILNSGLVSEPWPEPIYVLNVGNVKQAAVITDPLFPAMRAMPQERFKILFVEHLIVSSLALEGPDIWIDGQLTNGLFVSDRLAKALKKAGLAKGWALKKTLKPQMH